ncbi:MAG: hypothetical protein JWM35_1821, partial [Verrucomicrobia bacterium]|nr:hypothetical protein [Verrucomicrobiota bacterium]
MGEVPSPRDGPVRNTGLELGLDSKRGEGTPPTIYLTVRNGFQLFPFNFQLL